MDEQLNLFKVAENTDALYLEIEAKLKKFIDKSNEQEFELQITKINNGYSYKCYNIVWLWIIKKSSNNFIEFNNTPNDLFSRLIEKQIDAKLNDGRITIISFDILKTLDSIEDILIYKYNYLRLHEPVDSFGCCSRYLSCSNEKKCLQNDIKLSKGCAYKKNLDKGIIFYGKNRNIDE